MRNDIVQLEDIFNTGAFSEGVPKITVVDPIYDDTWDAVGVASAHNLEMFWFTTYYDEAAQADVDFQRIADELDEFKAIGDYTVYIGHSQDESVYDGIPVRDCSYNDGRLLLFV